MNRYYMQGICRNNRLLLIWAFITAVNNQSNYNKDGIVRAIPIIVYHTLVNYPDLSDSNRPIDTTLNLFDAEMKYLYDNGFKVLTMSDLGYDDNSNYLYVKSDNRWKDEKINKPQGKNIQFRGFFEKEEYGIWNTI